MKLKEQVEKILNDIHLGVEIPEEYDSVYDYKRALRVRIGVEK